ncbi:serine acetyltransferase [Bacillus mycoides]|uniref:serine O-acetyltransferase n=1 Tax=Bacillus mycoides TaxID=1405 RepID=UPI002111B42F|nr:serine acetyltransferase [Bacillus mycoides]MCQ6564939.1 serine acetyltransferase [Bacillus mycoides]
MKELKSIITCDLYRYYGKTGRRELIKNILKTPGFKYTYIFRHCHYHYKNNNKIRYFLYKFLLIKYRHKYGYEIPVDTNIGKGFCITHFGSIAINPDAQIGENVNISKGITIGTTYRGGKKGSPIIGDKVWIGPSAIIVGKIKVGSNVLIAPGAYVNFDVPNNSIVVGNPGKIIYSENATDEYIQNTFEEK